MEAAIYARYSSRNQDSIQDQIREILQDATSRNLWVSLENVFIDLAISGRKKNRPGLNALRKGIEEKRFKTVLLFSTSRLGRRAYQVMQFVNEEIVERGLRCIFAKNRIDTRDSNWQTTHGFQTVIDEQAALACVDNIRAGHQGRMLSGHVFGTVPFGYDGKATGQQSMRGKDLRMLVVDPDEAKIVVHVFEQFAHHRVPMVEIARRLTADTEIPLSPRSIADQWTPRAVRYLLSNERYRGIWKYGVTESILKGSKDYIAQVKRAEPLRTEIREDLRIVSDDLFFRAQERLARNESFARGRKPKSAETTRCTRLLSGLFRCSVHGCPLHVGGSHGQYLFCSQCLRMPKEDRPLATQLNRKLADRLLLERLSEFVLLDKEAVQGIVDHFCVEFRRMQMPDAGNVESLERRETRLNHDIELILRNLGESDEDIRQSERILSEKRRELASVRSSLAQLRDALANPLTPPDVGRIYELLDNLSQILQCAAKDGTPENLGDVRNVIDLLTGGQIDLVQMGERRRKRGWLRGTFSVTILKIVADRLSLPLLNTQVSESALQVVIDFKDEIDDSADVDRVMELFDEGLLYKEIADRLGMNRNRITKLAQKGCAQRGIAVPDGRGRRKRLEKKQRPIPMYRKLADEVHQMWKAGESVEHIARTLNCNGPTVDAAIAFWHSSRGLAVPAGSERKQDRNARMEQLYREKLEIKAIATALRVSVTTVRLTLRKRLQEQGEEFIDGRTRRHQTR